MSNRPTSLPLTETQKETEQSNDNDVRYLLIPLSERKARGGDTYRPRANSGVVLLAAGFDNIPPPPKWVFPFTALRKRINLSVSFLIPRMNMLGHSEIFLMDDTFCFLVKSYAKGIH